MWYYTQWNTTQSLKRWNIVICNNTGRSWMYCAKWNKSDARGWELYDFTHMWDISIKYKATNEWTQQTLRCVQKYAGYRGEGGEGKDKEGKGVIYGDRRLHFGWWALNRVCRYQIIKLYTLTLYNGINQCYPNIFNFKNAQRCWNECIPITW